MNEQNKGKDENQRKTNCENSETDKSELVITCLSLAIIAVPIMWLLLTVGGTLF